MELGLKGKAAVITGGSVGIGLAIAEGLAAEGVDLLLAARDAARLSREAERVAAAYGVRVEPRPKPATPSWPPPRRPSAASTS
jgi:3-oxoacyl-[acyl-carrier protein] reductase